MLPFAPNTGQSLYSLPSINFPAPSFQSQPFTGSDPNAPEQFKTNVQFALHYVNDITRLARSALVGIENAYNPGTNPMQTASDIAALKDNLVSLSDLLRQTGVGALPLLPDDGTVPVSLDGMIQETSTNTLQTLYDSRKRIQENNGVVANLLSEVTKR
ncbi:hypothetical protein BD410DRAFT_781993 [Rickenella mellea]|uniref:Uncharacterized protein n=1 Tax=Rickenella mellea TaxID=50990 RepID=A0A4Y7QK58_9AGAM|nr:hypothetical protein BD410DRAFT_781993 [Rickenella mellea]